jgi:hypothetical protein
VCSTGASPSAWGALPLHGGPLPLQGGLSLCMGGSPSPWGALPLHGGVSLSMGGSPSAGAPCAGGLSLCMGGSPSARAPCARGLSLCMGGSPSAGAPLCRGALPLHTIQGNTGRPPAIASAPALSLHPAKPAPGYRRSAASAGHAERAAYPSSPPPRDQPLPLRPPPGYRTADDDDEAFLSDQAVILLEQPLGAKAGRLGLAYLEDGGRYQGRIYAAGCARAC